METGEDHSRHLELCASCSSLLDGMRQAPRYDNSLFVETVVSPTEETGMSAAA